MEESPSTPGPTRPLLDRLYSENADRLQNAEPEYAEAVVVHTLLDTLTDYMIRKHPLALESLMAKASTRVAQELDYDEAHQPATTG